MATRDVGNVNCGRIREDGSVRQSVRDLATGLNIFHLDHRVMIDLVEQQIQCHSVSSGYVSHRRASAFDDYLEHCFIVIKHVQQSVTVRMFCVRSDINQSLSNKILPT